MSVFNVDLFIFSAWKDFRCRRIIDFAEKITEFEKLQVLASFGFKLKPWLDLGFQASSPKKA